MQERDSTGTIAAVVEPIMAEMGYELVRVQLSGKQRPTLQIMAERADRANMTVDDCAEISRTVSAVLDVEDPIHGSYTLEVSSPGIDRPLTRPEDFDRFRGFEARVEVRMPVDGRRRFRGTLLGTRGGTLSLRLEGGDVELPIADIQRAKLVLTDELIAAASAERRNAAPERKE